MFFLDFIVIKFWSLEPNICRQWKCLETDATISFKSSFILGRRLADSIHPYARITEDVRNSKRFTECEDTLPKKTEWYNGRNRVYNNQDEHNGSNSNVNDNTSSQKFRQKYVLLLNTDTHTHKYKRIHTKKKNLIFGQYIGLEIKYHFNKTCAGTVFPTQYLPVKN